MKILVTVGIFPPDIGGPATFVPEIVNHLQNEHNYEIDILTLSDSQNLNIKNEFSVSKINRNLPLPYRWFSTILKIYKLAKDKDLIFVNGLGTETTIANIFLKKRLLEKLLVILFGKELIINPKHLTTLTIFKKTTTEYSFYSRRKYETSVLKDLISW